MINKIFVYGTLQRGMYNEKFLPNVAIKSAYNATINGDLYMVKGATFPAVVNKNSSNIVHGELYELKDKLIDSLIKLCDRLEGHPNFYKRETTSVTDEFGNKHMAYVYILVNHEDLGKRIHNGRYKSEYYGIIGKNRW